jgi:hypothetical protein
MMPAFTPAQLIRFKVKKLEEVETTPVIAVYTTSMRKI